MTPNRTLRNNRNIYIFIKKNKRFCWCLYRMSDGRTYKENNIITKKERKTN